MGVDNAAVARRYMTEIWEKGDPAAIDELVADDILLRDPMTNARGIDTIRERVAEANKAFTDVTITIHEVIVAGNRVVVRHTWRAQQVGTFLGVPATNRIIKCEVVELLQIEHGKVVENLSFFDLHSMLQQMTALPAVDDPRPHAMASTS
jgi:steroid delta-isomerase-like uncharacterized protein